MDDEIKKEILALFNEVIDEDEAEMYKQSETWRKKLKVLLDKEPF